MNRIIRYLILPAYRPNSRIKELLGEKKKVMYGFLHLLIVGLLYTFTVAILASKKIPTAVEPFLNIPVDSYYHWEIYFTIPVFILTVTVFAGISRLVGELMGGKGSFENIFSIYAVVTVLPLLITMWVPETILAIMQSEGQKITAIPPFIDLLRQVTGVLWPLVITIIGIKMNEGFSWLKSSMNAIISFIPYTILILIFIR